MISQHRKIIIGVIAIALVLVWWRWSGSDEGSDPADRQTDSDSSDGDSVAAPSLSEGRGIADRIRSAMAKRGLADTTPVAVGSAVVEGVVRDLTGSPVGGVDVLFRGPVGESSATSDGAGQFSIELGSGTYDVRAIGDKLISRNVPALQVLAAGPDSEPQTIEVVVERMATLAGRVLSHDGSSIEDAAVHAIASNPIERRMIKSGLLLDNVLTESDGSFELDTLGKKELVLEARSGQLRARLLVAQVKPGERRDGLVIKLSEPITVSGTVADPDGRLVRSAEVSLVVNAGRFSHSQKIATDSSGRFAFEPMTRGGITLEARADGWAPSPLLVISKNKIKGGSLSFDLVLQRGNSVAGRVIDGEGNPLGGVRLRLGRGGSSFKALERYSSDDGTFEIAGVDRSKYWLSAVKGGYATGVVEGVEPPSRNLEVTLLPFGSIRGKVTDASGRALSSFVVRVDRLKQRGVARVKEIGEATRYSDGTYEMSQLEPGRYELTISAGGHQSRQLSVEVPPGEVGDGGASLAAI